jgi:outer membrane protein assembly factor BamB
MRTSIESTIQRANLPRLRARLAIVGLVTLMGAASAHARDWPQWRGTNRDGKVTGFKAHETWPKELQQKWKVPVGDGVATPALVGDKLYVFTRQEGKEILRCLSAATGEELWQEKYDADAVKPPASSFSGPRSSPTVALGKVVTLGVQGTLSCFAADTGKLLWRNDDFRGDVPQFAAASSPIVLDGLCIMQFGDERNGGVIAYDLESGKEKWKWSGNGPAYGSPVLITVDGAQAIITPTAKKMVALTVADGKLLWEIPYTQGRYNAATPIVSGKKLIYAGPNKGTTAVKLEKQGTELASEALWANPDNSVQFNTPVLRDGLVYGISGLNSLFCVNADDGQTVWTAPLGMKPNDEPKKEDAAAKGRRRGRGMGRGGYGSVVDAGSVLVALTPSGELTIVEPGKQFKQLASYKVAEEGTYAYPVLSGNRVFIKDKDSIALWTTQ